MRLGRSFWRNCTADRLTATVRALALAMARCGHRQGRRSTHSPMARMRPVSSAKGMNRLRASSPRSRVQPAHERLGADGGAGPAATPAAGSARRARPRRWPCAGRQAASGAGRPPAGCPRVKNRKVLLPFVLRAGHGRVGTVRQRVEVGTVVREHGDARWRVSASARTARSRKGSSIASMMRRAKSAAPTAVGVGEQDGELVTAEPGDRDVPAAQVEQPATRSRWRMQVADGVSEGVVDGLEVVEVDEDQGVGRGLASRAGKRRPRLLASSAVGQSGQLVVQGEVEDPLLRLRCSVTSRLTSMRPSVSPSAPKYAVSRVSKSAPPRRGGGSIPRSARAVPVASTVASVPTAWPAKPTSVGVSGLEVLRGIGR